MSWHRALAATRAYHRGVPSLACYAEGGSVFALVRYASTSRKAAPASRERIELKPAPAPRAKTPSKLPRKAAPSTQTPLAASKPAVVVKEYTSVSDGSRSRAASSPERDEEWGWQKADFQPEGWLVEQRTLFSRPNELLGGEKIRYAQWGYVFAVVIVANVLAWPDAEKMEQARADFIARRAVAEARGGFTPEELEAEQEELNNRVGRMRRIWDNVTDTMDPKRYAIIGAVCLSVFVLHRIISRNVLEIRQIRRTRTPSSTDLQQAAPEVQNKVRVTTSLRDIKMPLVRGAKDFDLQDTGVINLPSAKTTLLGFRAGKNHDYRIDMTVTPKLVEAVNNPNPKAPDVVVSMSRLERVWKLENPPPKRMFWAPVSDWFDRAAAARSAEKK